MKPANLICFALFVLGVVLWLLQLWFKVWTPDMFFKLSATDGAFLLVAVLWVFLVKENKASAKITKSGLD
jgi:hypothetical protein